MIYISRLETLSEAEETITRRIGLNLVMAMYTRSFHRFKIVQQCMGIELWRHGSPGKVFDTLSSMGLSQTASSARRQVDQLRGLHNEELFMWKKDIEVMLD